MQDEGIKSEHLNAILKKAATIDDNLYVEDSDGLLPCHYSAITGYSDTHFSSWSLHDRKDSFLNKSLTGFYQGSTGAWWLSRTARGINILQQEFAGLLNTINLYAEPDFKFSRSSGKVLNQLLKYATGRDIINAFSDEIFFDINWNTKSNSGDTAGWQLAAALSNQFARLFQLPYDKLAQIDWNAYSSEKQPGVTMTLQMGVVERGQILLRSLPEVVINSINWSVKSTYKSQSLIELVTSKIAYRLVLLSPDIQELKVGNIYVKEQDKKLFYSLINPKGELIQNVPIHSLSVPDSLTREALFPLTDGIIEIASKARHINIDYDYFLDKFTFDKLIALCISLDLKDPAFPQIAIKAIKKLNESITDEILVNTEKVAIDDMLSNFSSLFLSLKGIKQNHPLYEKEINGLKGKVIYRMSINEKLATQLLSMPAGIYVS